MACFVFNPLHHITAGKKHLGKTYQVVPYQYHSNAPCDAHEDETFTEATLIGQKSPRKPKLQPSALLFLHSSSSNVKST